MAKLLKFKPQYGCVLLDVLKRMALFRYLKPVDNLPDPNGPLSTVIHPSVTAEVNRQVRAIEQQSKKQGEYSKHSTVEKAAIGKYASENKRFCRQENLVSCH